jgi:hypothetical protein
MSYVLNDLLMPPGTGFTSSTTSSYMLGEQQVSLPLHG